MIAARLTIIALSTIGVAACATAPSPVVTPSPTAPSRAFAKTLHLCDGDHIDNAPATDRKKHVLGFKPMTRVSGVTLARAPVRGCLSSGFGRRHDRAGTHAGIDLSTRHPRPIYAGGSGEVEKIGTINGYGKTVVISHNARVKTRYGHLSSYNSKMYVGHKVRQGDVIGRTGKTGNATAVILHYEIIVDGAPRDPLSVGN